jgi:hypothetical protein
MKTVGIIFLATLMVSPLALAKSPKSLIKSLNKLNAKPISPGINQCSDDPEYLKLVSGEDEALLQQCAIELCGKADVAVSGNLIDRTFDQYVENGVVTRFSEIESELAELIKKDITVNKQFIERMKSTLVDGKFDFKFGEWESYHYDRLAERAFDEHIDLEIDKDVEVSKRLTMKPNYPEGATDAFKAGLDNYLASKKQILMTDPQQALYEDLYSQDEAKALLADAWQKFYPVYQEKLKENPEFMKDQKQRVEEALEEIKTNNGENYATGNLLSSIKMLNLEFVKATTGTYPDFPSSSKCMEKVCQLGVQDFATNQNIIGKLAELEKANNDPNLASEKLLICKTNLAMKGLKESDTESFLKLAPEIKKRFLARATKGFSEHSLKELEKYLTENLNLSFKQVKEEAPVQKFIDGIHTLFKAEDTTEEAEQNPPSSEVLMSLLDYDQFGMGVDPLARAAYCESQASSAIWDAFVPQKYASADEGEDMDLTKDNIMVSKFSCTHQGHGKSVLAHEMGHAMSYAFAGNKLSESSLTEFKKLRACAKAHHKDPSKLPPYPDLSHEGDILQTEEDTADLVAYMTYPEDDLIFECVLLETTSDGSKYTKLGLENPYPTDTHSAPLFRAVTEAIHKNKTLPAACSKLVQESTKFGFEKCF